ncbi:hypothetical protein PMIN07_005073 [Paraphaeosphaeria minitans]
MFSFLSVIFFSAAVNTASLSPRDRPKFVPGKYLVQLRSDIDAVSVASHHETVHRPARRGPTDSPVERTFSIGSLSAYLGSFDEQAAIEISDLEEVLSVVPDEYIYLEKTDFTPLAQRALVTHTSSVWSLGDLSHKVGNATEYVYDSTAGEGTTAYVFDTGIRLSHTEFEGRARFGVNGITNSTNPSGASKDNDGHGTHCAATVVGKTFGVANKASVVDVKVFDGATGSTSAILTGIQWAVSDVFARNAASTSVFSMSLSAQTTSTLLDDAVKAAYDVGILTIVAAGNENAPIAPLTPARLPEAFTVGMTQPDRGKVNIVADIYGSNYGPEMDIFAPGRDIVSTSHLSDTGTATKTGTSMATPLVAGLDLLSESVGRGFSEPR